MFQKSKVTAGVLAALGGALLVASPAWAQTTERIEVTGSRIKTVGATSSSDAGAARCTAELQADGWHVNGTKCFVTNGQPGLTHSSTTVLPLKSASETVLPCVSITLKAGAGWPTTAWAEAVPQARWHDAIHTLPADRPLMIVANEFFDTLPIRQLVRGAEVDYVESLGGAAFRVNNPQAASGCGCGSSFAV